MAPSPPSASRAAAGGAVALLALLALCALSLATGAREIALDSVWRAVLHPGDGSRDAIIVWQLRLPRTLLAVAVGVLLAVAGVVMQGMTRNPLAEPGLLGVNAGASLAVVLAVALVGTGSAAGSVGPALAGSAVAAVIVVLVGMRAGPRANPTRLLLAGTALTASLASVTGVVTLSDPRTFGDYRSWVVGSVAGRDPADLAWLLPLTAVVVVAALLLVRPLAVLALGDDSATALGSRVGRVRLAGFALVTVACAAATAAAGPISFVGLVVPHAVRLVVGRRERAVLVGSVVAGPMLVLLADVVGRIVVRPGELEAGIVTAFVGAPVLLALVLRRSRGAAGSPGTRGERVAP
jgi:iron complex transport system permease protein